MSATRASTEKSLIGQPDSVLSLEWMQKLAKGESLSDILPFSGRPNLPSKEMVVKLYFDYRSLDKKEMVGDICFKVVADIMQYWRMANLETVALFRVKMHVMKEIEAYKGILKSLTKKSQVQQGMREFAKTVKVTNDVAECGVKLISVYMNILTKDEKMRSYLLQGVEYCRRKFPDFKKSTLNH